jgi:regulator of RNase E activity RraA
MPNPPQPVSAEALAALGRVSTATVSSQLRKRGIRSIFIDKARPLNPAHCRFVAPAYTLRFIPMREDLSRNEILADPDYPARKAIEAIPPGHALVVDCRGEQRAGVLGDILMLRLKMRGAMAVVADGPMRDAAELVAMDFPIFCSGAAAPPSLNVHYGADLECPIACGGVAVLPGDVLVGDADGVVVVPHALAAEIAGDSVEQEVLEIFLKQRLAEGHSTIGTYPPNESTERAYETWRAAGNPRGRQA